MSGKPRGIGRDQDHWRLDYGWARRGGRWHELTDVMLVGHVAGDDAADAGIADALRRWVAQQGSAQALVDGVPRTIFYSGGVLGYLEAADDAARCAIHLHSHGEDAFDSLSGCSKEIARFVRGLGCEGRLQWREARHDRVDHQLQWP